MTKSLIVARPPSSAIWRICPSLKWSSHFVTSCSFLFRIIFNLCLNVNKIPITIISVAVWRVYPSWVNDKLRPREGLGHSRKCFGWGSQGTIFVCSSKLPLFFLEVCSVKFRRVFCFPRFCKIWRQTFERCGFWFRRCLGALFEIPLGHRTSFCELTTSSCIWKLPFFFSKQSRCYLPESYGDTHAEQSILVTVLRKLEWKLHFRGGGGGGGWRKQAQKNHRSSWRLVRVACGNPWSEREKSQRSQRVIKFSSLSAPTKIEELTAGSDEKNTAQPRRESNPGSCKF